jgi:hypothetical protein
MICSSSACSTSPQSDFDRPPENVAAVVTEILKAAAIPPRYFRARVWEDFSRAVTDKLSHKLPYLNQEIDEALRAQSRQHRRLPAEPGKTTAVDGAESTISRLAAKLERHVNFWKRFVERKPLVVDVVDTSATLASIYCLRPNLAKVLRVWTDSGGRELEIDEDGAVVLNYRSPQNTCGFFRLWIDVLVPNVAFGFRGTLKVDPEIVGNLAARCVYAIKVDPAAPSIINLVPCNVTAQRRALIRHLLRAFRGRYSRQEVRRRLRNGVEPSITVIDKYRGKYRVSLSAGKVADDVARFHKERLETARRRSERIELYREAVEAEAGRVGDAIAGGSFLQMENVVREVAQKEAVFTHARTAFWERCQGAMYRKSLPAEPFVLPPWREHLPSRLFKRLSATTERSLRFSLASFNSSHEHLLEAYTRYKEILGIDHRSEVRAQYRGSQGVAEDSPMHKSRGFVIHPQAESGDANPAVRSTLASLPRGETVLRLGSQAENIECR